MALTLTHVELSAAIRLGDSAEETAEALRLLAFTTEAISKHLGAAYAGAPGVIVNEAAIRLAGYLFDQPNAGRGVSFANAGRNSGAWTILLPYRVHRAGSTGNAIAAAQEAVGTTGNPVTGLAITVDGKLEVIFADGATVELDLPAGMGGGVLDQTARDAAAAAQATADGATTSAANAQSAIEDHERTTHNTDTTARDAAAAAQGTADNAATAATAAAATANANTGRLDAFPAGTGGVDQMARDAASAAQGTADGAQTAADGAQADLDTHEGTPHNTDATARDAAAAAQGTADGAQTAAAAAQGAIAAHAGDPDAHHVPPTGSMGGGPTVLYEAATAAIGTATGLIPGNVACPETGEIEVYADQVTGTRQGGVAYAKIPAARIRGAVSTLNIAYSNDSATLLAIPHGANRGIGIAVQAVTNFLMLSAQADGTFYVRILHVG